MGLHLAFSFDLSVYDLCLGVFALCILFLLAFVAKQPPKAQSVGRSESILRLADDPTLSSAQSTQSVDTPVSDPRPRVTYGQSTDVRERARALRSDVD